MTPMSVPPTATTKKLANSFAKSPKIKKRFFYFSKKVSKIGPNSKNAEELFIIG